MASQKTKRNVQYAIGATGAVAVGGGGSLAASHVISKALSTDAAKSAGGRISATIGPKALGVLSTAARFTGYGAAAYGAASLAAGVASAAQSIVDARKRGESASAKVIGEGFAKGFVSPVSTARDMIFSPANAQSAERKKPERRASPQAPAKPETMDEAMARVGGKFGDPEQYRLAAENDRRQMAAAKTQAQRDAHERRALANESIYKQRTGRHIGPTLPGSATGEQVTSEQKPGGKSIVGKTVGLMKEIGDLFKVDTSEFDQRRAALMKSREIIERQMAKGVDRGAGIRPETKAALDENDRQLAKLAKEQSEANPYAQAFKTVAPIAASLGGFAAGGGILSGAKALGQQATVQATEVAKLGKQAGQLLKTKPNGIIAGTPVGDKAKAIVNESYARGGAMPAFPSPGYPGSKSTAQQVFSNSGRPTGAHYAAPALNALAAVGAVGASMTETLAPTEAAKQGERIAAGWEAGVALGQWKSLATAPVVRPAAAAVSAIEALRNRVARETAHGANKASQAAVGAVVARAKGNAAIARNATAARVSGSAVGRDSAALSAVKASAELGERRALASANVQVARNIGKRRTIESGQDVSAARKGMPLSRPDTANVNRLVSADNRRIQPTPGRYFTRSYHRGPKAGTVEQVRKASAR